MVTQVSFFEAILDLLCIKPPVLLGFIPIGLLLFWLFKKDNKLPKLKMSIGAVLMYYYLCIVFQNIVGIPTIKELVRMASLGESLFNPNINLIPLDNGLGLEFIFNIICFIPLGFFCPLLSRSYEKTGKTVLLGIGVSLLIETSQLFTLYRATDINDLATNVFGTFLGVLCFKLLAKLRVVKSESIQDPSIKDPARLLPVFMAAFAFGMTFIN